jgi:two-component system, sensor histidine kinase and response regulator
MKHLQADILIVDDRPENLAALEAALAELGQGIVRATSGQQALEILLDREFAVILLDVRMPDMDGFETAGYIRKSKRSMLTPIIFVTAGEHQFGQVTKGYAVGAVDYIIKPFDEEILRSKVRVFIDLYLKGKHLTLNAEELAHANAELRHAYQELEVLSYTVAHDLRAPLRAMAGFSRILREEYPGRPMDEAAQEYLLRIESGARQMDGLIQSLLAYCRVAGSTIELERLDPGDIIRQVTDVQIGDAELSLSQAFPPVLAHRGFLTQAIFHLVSNALKFVDPGVRPKVRIRHETRGTRLRIWIEDNGIGIAPEYHDRLFRTFERLKPAAFEGRGMGLAVVRAALERMGGEVGLESAPGQGSKFWIELAQCVEGTPHPRPAHATSP